MGKRRKQEKVVIKKAKVERFQCPKCHKPESVQIRVHKDPNTGLKIGECFCENCRAQYKTQQLTVFENQFTVYNAWKKYEDLIQQQNIQCPYCGNRLAIFQCAENAAQIICEKCQNQWYLEILKQETFQEAVNKFKQYDDSMKKQVMVRVQEQQNQQEQIQKQSKKTKQTKKSTKQNKQNYSDSEQSDQQISDESYNENDAKVDEKQLREQVRAETDVIKQPAKDDQLFDDLDDNIQIQDQTQNNQKQQIQQQNDDNYDDI